jgi:hypothetical protein
MIMHLLSGLLPAYNHSDLQKVDDTPVVAAASVFVSYYHLTLLLIEMHSSY